MGKKYENTRKSRRIKYRLSPLQLKFVLKNHSFNLNLDNIICHFKYHEFRIYKIELI